MTDEERTPVPTDVGTTSAALVAFSLPASTMPLGEALADHPSVRVELERVVPMGGPTCYVWVVGDEREAALDSLKRDGEVDAPEPVDELPDRTLVRLEPVDAPVLRLAERVDATVVQAASRDGEWELKVRFPDRESLSAFYREAIDRGIPITVRWVHGGGPTTDAGYGLTPAQAETILAAFREGYFDVPRGTTIAGLADELGVSEQAISERLRRGLTALVTGALGPEEGDDR